MSQSPTRLASFVAGVITLVLTGGAGVGWLVFIAGFGAWNTDSQFFDLVDIARRSFDPAAATSLLFLPFNPHYIAAVVSPFLFITIIGTVIFLLFVKTRITTYLFIPAHVAVMIQFSLVLALGGAVIHSVFVPLETNSLIRNPNPIAFQPQRSAVLAGMIIELVCLIAAVVTFYLTAILGQKANSADSRYKT